jgi:ACS family glucarate transporter-like MFS transporter
VGGAQRSIPEAVRMLIASRTDPTRFHSGVRWYVLAAVVFLSFITIVDRVCISAAKSAMSRELSISDLDFGLVFGAFALGYAVLMVPSGWLADTFGPRKFLTATVALWSCFTLATGIVRTLAPLIAVRFVFGMAEAGAFPTATRAIYNWFPISERGRALGLLNMGSRLGAAVGLPIMSLSVVALGWRMSYYLLAGLGLLWAAFWFLWFRDDPKLQSGVSIAELKHIRDALDSATLKHEVTRANWRMFFSSRNFYLILYQYFASNFTFFICFTWLLPYTQDRYHLSPSDAGFYASIPLYCGAFATWFGGYCADAIFKRGHWKASRALPAAFGFGLSTLCLLVAGSLDTVQSFIACFALATLGVDLAIAPSWAVCSDVGKEYTGTLSGAMNMMGALGSFASSLAFPYLLKITGAVQTYFWLTAALNVFAILCWLVMRPDQPLIPE